MTHEDQLRDWARGHHGLVSATELLICAYGGVYAEAGNPWIGAEEGENARPWIDLAKIPDHVGALAGGERRLLMVAASLADVGVSVNLGEAVSGLDRKEFDLVLVASAYDGGSHEHSHIAMDQMGERPQFEKLPPLHPRTKED